MKKYLILLATAFFFGACGCDDEDDDDTGLAERTVLVYMAADNNLSKFADLDLKELKEGSKQLGNGEN